MNTCLRTAGKGTYLRSFILSALLVMTTGHIAAQSDGQIALNPSHPETYTVEQGDTLWDISSAFLQDPWYWPEIWYVNPQVVNPHLIYPGDVLKLVYIDGQPRVTVAASGATRLSPAVREEPLDQAITSVSYQDIRPFLAGGMIMDKKEIDELPYIAALRDHLIAGAGHEVYVVGLPEDQNLGSEYMVLRVDEKLRDPDSGDVLGYEVLFIGNGELRAKGSQGKKDVPDTVFLTRTNREAMRGDKIRKTDLRLPLNFFPSAPDEEVNGTIISVVDGVSRIGQYQMVIINRGMEHGLDAGSVLSVWQTGQRVRDYDSFASKITLPDNLGGYLMVVKAYDKISYALVMEAELEMQVGDRVQNPG